MLFYDDASTCVQLAAKQDQEVLKNSSRSMGVRQKKAEHIE